MEDKSAELPVTELEKLTLKGILKFLVPSLIGIALFLYPVPSGDGQTIFIGIINDWLLTQFASVTLEIVVAVFLISLLGSLYFVIMKPDWQERKPLLHLIFSVTPFWLFMRILAVALGLMVYFQIGPDIIIAKDTGMMVLNDIAIPAMFVVFIACYLMPFLTDFGFMEFVGSAVRRPFEWLFRLPGRSAVDATASFLSANSVGVLITIGQYEKGQYTAREAASIATNFSVVSISFSLIVASVAGISHIFFTWYLSVILACIVCAFITVRIPPLSRVSHSYYAPVGSHIHEEKPDNMSNVRWGLHEAVRKAGKAPSFMEMLKNSTVSALNIIIGVHGPSMVIATISAITVFYTPIYEWLTVPLVPVLEFMQLPEAAEAAPGFIAGLLDMFMPAIIAGKIDSEFTRFVLAGLSLTQLIYLGEIGVMIIRSVLPIGLKDLLILFLLRTIIVTPILMVAGLVVL